jgi:hypothetical protein
MTSPDLRAADEDVGETGAAFHAEVFGDFGLAQVGVEQGDALAGVGEGDGEADRGGRPSLGIELVTTKLDRPPMSRNCRLVRSAWNDSAGAERIGVTMSGRSLAFVS